MDKELSKPIDYEARNIDLDRRVRELVGRLGTLLFCELMPYESAKDALLGSIRHLRGGDGCQARRRLGSRRSSDGYAMTMADLGSSSRLHQPCRLGVVDVAGDRPVLDALNGLVNDEHGNEEPFLRLHGMAEAVLDGDV